MTAHSLITAFAWFTARRRQAIYAALAATTVLLVAAGLITDAEATQWLDVAQKALAALASILAIVNLTPDEFDTLPVEDDLEDE